ncbi:hypothetical protein SDC9_156928 [bioreactor metagenome]|uniref:Uncharacterized protein n=1 Tax=bioreactor metagenome TaxID=1076179 RepID=A0A645F617_9ZZZZ
MNDGMLFIVSASVSHIYAAAMAAGSSEVAYHGFLFALPLFLCICLDYSDGRENLLRILKLIIVIVCIFFSIACIGQKRINAYIWWGSIDEPYYVKTEYSDIKALKGIKLSAHTREVYEVITKLIKENGTDKDTIWGYPHVKLFNVLSDNYNMDTFMPVVFYDVSADFYIEQETELLSSNLPDFIIWQDIPGVKEIHEDVFRDGKLLKQRDMETMLEKEISEKYILIGEIDSIKIYRHNQGQPIRYTYGISRLEYR